MCYLALVDQQVNKHLSTPVAFVNMFHQENVSSLEWGIEKMSSREEDTDVHCSQIWSEDWTQIPNSEGS